VNIKDHQVPVKMTMESFSIEMQRTIEELTVKRGTLAREIENDEVYMQVLQKEIKILQEKDKKMQARIDTRVSAQGEYEKVLIEADAAVKKVQEASNALMGVMGKAGWWDNHIFRWFVFVTNARGKNCYGVRLQDNSYLLVPSGHFFL